MRDRGSRHAQGPQQAEVPHREDEQHVVVGGNEGRPEGRVADESCRRDPATQAATVRERIDYVARSVAEQDERSVLGRQSRVDLQPAVAVGHQHVRRAQFGLGEGAVQLLLCGGRVANGLEAVGGGVKKSQGGAKVMGAANSASAE